MTTLTAQVSAMPAAILPTVLRVAGATTTASAGGQPLVRPDHVYRGSCPVTAVSSATSRKSHPAGVAPTYVSQRAPPASRARSAISPAGPAPQANTYRVRVTPLVGGPVDDPDADLDEAV